MSAVVADNQINPPKYDMPNNCAQVIQEKKNLSSVTVSSDETQTEGLHAVFSHTHFDCCPVHGCGVIVD